MDPLVALAVAFSFDKKKRKKRKAWSKKWFLERKRFGHVELLRELRTNEPGDYRNFLRMDETAFEELLTLVTPLIQKSETNMRVPISPLERLSITLRFLATGNTFEDMKFMTAISPQSIGRIVMETCEAIVHCLKEYIQLPSTQEEWSRVSEGFKTQWNFPHCVGAIDGKHVAMKKPRGSGSFYYNYKKFFSIVLMAVVNANYEFLMVDVGVNGRVSDGGVISHTEFGKMLHDNELGIPEPDTLHENDDVPMPYVFVGDDAFAMTENLLKPFSEANGKLDEGKRTFNYRLSRARRVVENAFGILSSRFGVFQRQIPLSPDKSQIITLACCYLHNFLRRKSSRYIARESVDWEDANRDMHEGEWRAFQVEFEKLLPTHQRNFSARAKFTREMFQKYFCSKGMVPWQLDSIS